MCIGVRSTFDIMYYNIFFKKELDATLMISLANTYKNKTTQNISFFSIDMIRNSIRWVMNNLMLEKAYYSKHILSYMLLRYAFANMHYTRNFT